MARRARIATMGLGMATLDTRAVKPPPKVADEHYQTSGHRDWREAVIRRAGGRCEYVDASGLRCGRAERRMFADHKVELKDGGAPLDPANGWCLCGSHHTLKTAAARTARNTTP